MPLRLQHAPPSVAFIVTGQCRASQALTGANLSTAAATRRYLESHLEHVVRPHAADPLQSSVFLLLKESDSKHSCGADLCDIYRGADRLTCIQARLDDASCTLACPECRKRGRPPYPMLQHHTCFSQAVLAAWTPIWCTMWLAWQHVLRHEEQRGSQFSRVLYSRVDVLFTSSMGHWAAYTQEWHSGHLYCHDFVWVLSRRMAACALTVFPVQLRCQPNTQCCKPTRDCNEIEDALSTETPPPGPLPCQPSYPSHRIILTGVRAAPCDETH